MNRFKVLPLIDFLSKKIERILDATTCLEQNKRRAELKIKQFYKIMCFYLSIFIAHPLVLFVSLQGQDQRRSMNEMKFCLGLEVEDGGTPVAGGAHWPGTDWDNCWDTTSRILQILLQTTSTAHHF